MGNSGTYNIYLLVIVVLASIAYLPTLNAGFVYDDHILVSPITAYQDFDLKQIFLNLGNGLEYLPVRDLTLALDALIWKSNPFGYHLSNFVYFLLTLFLLFHVVRKLTLILNSANPSGLAFITTLIIALHPLNTEVVAFVSARNNILALMFILLSANFFLAGLAGKRIGFIYCLPVYLLALFAKASAVFYPVAVLLIYLCLTPFPQQRRVVWGTIGALFCLAATVAILHVNVADLTGISQPQIARFGIADFSSSLVRASLVPAFYLRYFIFPWPQSISYDEVSILTFAQTGVAITLYGLYLVLFLIAMRYRRQFPLLLIGLIWFFTALIPVSNIFPSSTFVADRYLFTGMPGLALVSATLLSLTTTRKFQLGLLLPIAILLLLTFKRTIVWQSDLSLWEAAYAVTPRTSAHQYFNLLIQNGQTDKALALAAAENPLTYRHSLIQCEMAYRDGRLNQSIEHCQEALELSEGYSNTVRNQVKLALARSYEKQNDVFQSIYQYLQIQQDNTLATKLYYMDEATNGIARLRLVLASQERSLETTARANPQDVRAQGDYGLFLLRTGRYAEAVTYLQRADELQPENWQILYNLGLAAIKDHNLKIANKAFTGITSSAPVYAEGLNHLALFHSEQGQHDRAIVYWQQAINAQPKNRSFRHNLARFWFRQGSRENALAVLNEGLKQGLEEDKAFYLRAIENL